MVLVLARSHRLPRVEHEVGGHLRSPQGPDADGEEPGVAQVELLYQLFQQDDIEPDVLVHGVEEGHVAMLLRRVQQRAGHDLQVIGTSATMTTQGTRDERRQAVADVGTRLFGVTVQANNVVDETLQRVAKVPVPANQDELRQAVQMEPPAPTVEAVTNRPLSAWVEEAFGLATEEGRLVRREPETFANAVVRLATETGLDEEFCAQRLRAVLDAGNQAHLIPGQPIFAFRLHQFLSSGSSVYATLESPEARHLTMEGQYKADEERVLFPLAFCAANAARSIT